MAVKLRLTRMGRKKRPYYRIVAVDSRTRRDGAYIEKVGTYDPVTRPARLEIDHDLAIKWLKRGATPSDTVRSLFRHDGVMLRFDMVKRDYEQTRIEEAVKELQERHAAKLAKKEAPKAEAKPAPKAEEKKEAPKEESKAEEKPAEEPKAEAKDEKKAEEKKEEPKAEAKAEEKKEEKAEQPKAEEKQAEGAEAEEKKDA